jgi:hypothetical protein
MHETIMAHVQGGSRTNWGVARLLAAVLQAEKRISAAASWTMAHCNGGVTSRAASV